MPEPIYLPKLGMTMEEGTLTRWLAADGDRVSRGQAIFEMETEKVETEVEADAEGILRRIAAEGTTLKPGAVVGVLLAEGENLPAGLPSNAPAPALAAPDVAAAARPASPAVVPPGDSLIRITPIARR